MNKSFGEGSESSKNNECILNGEDGTRSAEPALDTQGAAGELKAIEDSGWGTIEEKLASHLEMLDVKEAAPKFKREVGRRRTTSSASSTSLRHRLKTRSLNDELAAQVRRKKLERMNALMETEMIMCSVCEKYFGELTVFALSTF